MQRERRRLEARRIRGTLSWQAKITQTASYQACHGFFNIFTGQIKYRGFLKWWYPTTMGFPTKNDHFGVFLGYHHLRKHPYKKNKYKGPDADVVQAHWDRTRSWFLQNATTSLVVWNSLTFRTYSNHFWSCWLFWLCWFLIMLFQLSFLMMWMFNIDKTGLSEKNTRKYVASFHPLKNGPS